MQNFPVSPFYCISIRPARCQWVALVEHQDIEENITKFPRFGLRSYIEPVWYEIGFV